jgi:sulfotransferase family protein
VPQEGSSEQELDDGAHRSRATVAERGLRRATRSFGERTRALRSLPDFLIIGAQRAGTTTLYRALADHPQIRGAVLDKEVHFFDLSFEQGVAHYRGAFPTNASLALARARIGGPVLVGEATPYYLLHPQVPARVAATLPNAKLIAILRDPVERAWSQYRHEVDLGYETLSFEAALAAEGSRLAGEEERLASDPLAVSFAHQHHGYVARGRYAEQLERWYEHVPLERLLLLRAEDLFADPAGELRRVADLLGVVPWRPASWRPRNAAGSSSSIPPRPRAELRATFRPQNERLADLTGRDWYWDSPGERAADR